MVLNQIMVLYHYLGLSLKLVQEQTIHFVVMAFVIQENHGKIVQLIVISLHWVVRKQVEWMTG